MKKWEYKVWLYIVGGNFRNPGTYELMEESLNSMGSDGWRVLHINHGEDSCENGTTFTYFLEREKQEQIPEKPFRSSEYGKLGMNELG